MRCYFDDNIDLSNKSTIENIHIICENFQNLSNRCDIEEEIDRCSKNLVKSHSMNVSAHAFIASFVIIVLAGIEDDSYYSHNIDLLHEFKVFLCLGNRISSGILILYSFIVPLIISSDSSQHTDDYNSSQPTNTVVDLSCSFPRNFY